MTEKKKSNGAIWKKTGQYGEYFSGQLEIQGVKHNFKAFSNRFKKSERHPDFQIYLDTPKETKPVQADEDIPF